MYELDKLALGVAIYEIIAIGACEVLVAAKIPCIDQLTRFWTVAALMSRCGVCICARSCSRAPVKRFRLMPYGNDELILPFFSCKSIATVINFEKLMAVVYIVL